MLTCIVKIKAKSVLDKDGLNNTTTQFDLGQAADVLLGIFPEEDHSLETECFL